MDERPTLRTARLILRPFGLADAPSVQRLAGASEVADTTINIPHPYADGLAEAWVESHAPAFARREMIALAITGDEGLLGAVSLRLEVVHARAELGYRVGVPYWGRGIASEAASAMIAFGFDRLGLNRIFATHFSRNPASGRVMQKAGMVHEGLQRQHLRKAGRFEDLVCYSILRDDYERAHPAAP
jgi:ribosomal-protein-alanine N-acetyltransferase